MPRQFRFYFWTKTDGYWDKDESEFSTSEEGFVDMFNDLMDIFKEFCSEQNFDAVMINYIEEVPYDGE